MEYAYQNSTIAQILEAILGQGSFDGDTSSDIAEILLSILYATPYTKEPRSVLADLLIRLKAKIEGGSFEPYDGPHEGEIAEIIIATLEETEYTKAPRSRIAELFLALKAEIESYAEVTVSGAIANFTTSLKKPLVNLAAIFTATQESGTPTPQAPKAINGISAVDFYFRNSNFFDISTKTNNRALKWNDGDLFTDQKSVVSDFIEVKEGAKFTSNYIAQWCCYDKNKNYLGNILQNALITTSGADRADNTIPRGYGIYYLRLGYRSGLNNNEDMTEKTDIVLSYGNIALPFESYDGAETIVNLGGTYYGGYVNQDKDGKRKLVVTHKLLEWSDLSFRRSNNGGNWANYLFFANVADMKYNYLQKSDIYEIQSVGNVGDIENYRFRTSFSGTIPYVYFRNDDYTDVDDFVTAMNGHQFLYEITEPFEIDLPDGSPIIANVGVNNVFNDSGDSSVTYLAKIEDNIRKAKTMKAAKEALKKQMELEKELEIKEPEIPEKKEEPRK